MNVLMMFDDVIVGSKFHKSSGKHLIHILMEAFNSGNQLTSEHQTV
jgi:hypothetical protein